MNAEDQRVEALILESERQLAYLADETQSLLYLLVQVNLEILRELRRTRLGKVDESQ